MLTNDHYYILLIGGVNGLQSWSGKILMLKAIETFPLLVYVYRSRVIYFKNNKLRETILKKKYMKEKYMHVLIEMKIILALLLTVGFEVKIF